MLDKILNIISHKTIKEAVGLCFYIKNDESVSLDSVLLEKSKTGDLVVKDQSSFTSVKDFSEWYVALGKTIPVLWGIDGKPVLIKKTDSDNFPDKEQLIDQLISGAEPNDFIVNSVLEQESLFSTLIRKDAFDHMLQSLVELKIPVYRSFVGPVSILYLKDFLVANKGDSYQYGYYQIEEQDDNLFKLSRKTNSEDPIISGELNLSHLYVNAFGYAASFFTGIDENVLVEESENSSKNVSQFVHQKFFRPFFISTIALLLVLFLGNAYFFIDYQRTNEKLQDKSFSVQLMVNNYQKRRAIYDQKNKVFKTLNYDNVGMAWLSDQIGQVIPEQVTLSAVSINPVSKKSRKKDSPFDTQKIKLKGESKNGDAFGLLISSLSDLPFVEDIAYQNYHFNQSKRQGEFEIILNYKPNKK